jgi:hypothetical protein
MNNLPVASRAAIAQGPIDVYAIHRENAKRRLREEMSLLKLPNLDQLLAEVEASIYR